MIPSWEAFLTRYRPRARAIAQSLAAPSTDPDDVVQEAAVALLKAARTAGGRLESPGHARNYFLRAVRNLASRSHRSAGRTEPLVEEPAAGRPDPDAALVRERQRRLGRLLGELAPAERELVARRFLRRETLARISGETGIAISTLHSREKALLAKLRRRMESAKEERKHEQA